MRRGAAAAAGVSGVALVAIVVAHSSTGGKATGSHRAEDVARTAASEPAAGTRPGGGRAPGAVGQPDVPADVSVVGPTKLNGGQPVAIRVRARAGSQTFGFEAFLCKGDATFRLDADIRPTLAGKCASKPLSPGSDAYEEVPAAPPYQHVEGSFRPGVGTDRYATRDGTPVTVTCGPRDPCQLVLKLQFPNGFALRSYPLRFA